MADIYQFGKEPFIKTGNLVNGVDLTIVDTPRVLPRQVSSGVMRGTQQVGTYGGVTIDGSNNRISLGNTVNNSNVTMGRLNPSSPADQSFGFSITDTNGTVMTLGILNDGTLGMSITDSSGFLLFKLNGTTWYWYDKVNKVNIMQAGKLPDSTYGMVIAKTGINVSAAFS